MYLTFDNIQDSFAYFESPGCLSLGVVVMKNHEGYNDPTAGKAIRKTDKERCKRKQEKHLMYKIGDLQMFQDVVKVYNHDK